MAIRSISRLSCGKCSSLNSIFAASEPPNAEALIATELLGPTSRSSVALGSGFPALTLNDNDVIPATSVAPLPIITVTINETVDVSQPNAFADGETATTNQSVVNVNKDDNRMFVFNPGVSLDTLVRAINEIGAGPGDVMAILEALSQAGALRGELIII